MSRARRARYAALASHARWMEAMGEHEQIMAALTERDSRRAGEIMRQHDLGTAVPSSPRFGPPCPNRDDRLRFPNGMFKGRRTTMLATRTSIVSDMSGPRGSHSCGNACLDTVEHDRADLPAIFTPSPAKGAPPKGARRRARGRDGWAPRGTSDGLRADVSRAIRRLETADRLWEQRLRQPKHRAGEKDREGDRDEEDHIDRQRSA